MRGAWEEALAQLRGRHEGKGCIVLGCGPSIRTFDLMRCDGYVTVGCNAIGKVYCPTYYAIFDPLAYHEFHEDFYRCDSVHILPPWIEGECDLTIGYEREDKLGFTKDRLHSALAAGFLCLNLAYVMGCTPIYLIGIDGYDQPMEDFQFCPTPQEYREIGKRKWTPEKRVLTIQAYTLALKTMKAEGKRLVNLSGRSFLKDILGVGELTPLKLDASTKHVAAK